MDVVNPYEPPQVIDARLPQRGWFTLPRVFPKYFAERLLIVLPVEFALLLAGQEFLRGLARDMYSFATLDGRTVTYFEPSHWDEAAWGSGVLLSLAFFLAILVISSIGFRSSRTMAERWLASIAVVLCFLPPLLHAILDERPLEWMSHREAHLVPLMIGLALVSAMFQIWNGFNRRQPAWFLAWIYFTLDDRMQRLFGGRCHRRPGRP